MTEKKYITIGSLIEFEDSGNQMITIDNVTLKAFVDFLMEHGKKHLHGLTDEEIKQAQKDKQIPRIKAYLFDPSDKAPDIIKKNISIKIR